mmetsp:Transcript_8150/g.15790  ORF Transcript_8150/g.15790 Transcript_8150/m.15790 type:complete len:84 (-) Transcript_8150:8-259(-)
MTWAIHAFFQIYEGVPRSHQSSHRPFDNVPQDSACSLKPHNSNLACSMHIMPPYQPSSMSTSRMFFLNHLHCHQQQQQQQQHC